MQTETLARSTILSDIPVDHGSEELLAPLLLRVENAIRLLGIHLSFASLEELERVNAANRASWMPLFPVYRPSYWPDSKGDTFCLLGSEPGGRVIATLAVRIYDWPRTTFHDEACSLRLFYGDVDRFRRPNESCRVSAAFTREVAGRVALAGAVWVHPDWRKDPQLMAMMPRFARAYGLAKWNIDYYTLLMTEGVFRGGLTRKTGMANVDWSVDMFGCPLGDLRLGFLWMNRAELHSDLERCLMDLSTQVDVGIVSHRAQQDPRA